MQELLFLENDQPVLESFIQNVVGVPRIYFGGAKQVGSILW